MKMHSFKTFLKAENGVAAIEMAFILPFMLLLYFGLIDLTGLISFNRKITSVASSVADLSGQNRASILKTDIQDYFHVVNMIMDPTPDGDVSVILSGYRNVAGVPTKQWEVSKGNGPGCSATPNTGSMLNLMTAGNDLVVAQACMKYTPYVAEFMGEKVIGSTSFNVEQTIMLRPRSSLTLDCYQTVAGGTKC